MTMTHGCKYKTKKKKFEKKKPRVPHHLAPCRPIVLFACRTYTGGIFFFFFHTYARVCVHVTFNYVGGDCRQCRCPRVRVRRRDKPIAGRGKIAERVRITIANDILTILLFFYNRQRKKRKNNFKKKFPGQ